MIASVVARANISGVDFSGIVPWVDREVSFFFFNGDCERNWRSQLVARVGNLRLWTDAGHATPLQRHGPKRRQRTGIPQLRVDASLEDHVHSRGVVDTPARVRNVQSQVSNG